MAQIVGLCCRLCDQRISCSLDGDFCPECKGPVHNACRTLKKEEGACGLCGARTSEIAIEERSTKTSQNGISRWFSLNGRVSRSTYIFHWIPSSLLAIACLYGIAMLTKPLGDFGELIGTLGIFAVIALWMWSEVAVTVKRLHDLHRPSSDWFLLIIPIYNIYLSYVLLFKRGTRGDSRYGPDPLDFGENESVGDRLLATGSRQEMNGDWNLAFESYRRAAEKLQGQPNEEYAIHCIKRLQEKLALGNPPDRTEP